MFVFETVRKVYWKSVKVEREDRERISDSHE